LGGVCDKSHHELVKADLALEVGNWLDVVNFFGHVNRIEPGGKFFQQDNPVPKNMLCIQ
jgi:hypothetical protein